MAENPNAKVPGHKVGTGWPSWRYGPGGQSAIFERQGDVPNGWSDTPETFRRKPRAELPKPE